MKNTCPHETRLTSCLLGDLPPAEAAAVRAHLDACPACRAAAAGIAPLLDTLRDALAADAAAPLALEPERLAAVLATPPRRNRRVRFYLLSPLIGLAATLVIVLGAARLRTVFEQDAAPCVTGERMGRVCAAANDERPAVLLELGADRTPPLSQTAREAACAGAPAPAAGAPPADGRSGDRAVRRDLSYKYCEVPAQPKKPQTPKPATAAAPAAQPQVKPASVTSGTAQSKSAETSDADNTPVGLLSEGGNVAADSPPLPAEVAVASGGKQLGLVGAEQKRSVRRRETAPADKRLVGCVTIEPAERPLPPPPPPLFNPFVETADQPLSTFALDVDTASYTLARQSLLDGALPEPGYIRTEEVVNAFDYGDLAPDHATLSFRIAAEGAPAPFGRGTALVRLGVKGRRALVEDPAATLHTVASDVNIRVEWFPAAVRRYRQLGYENRALAAGQSRNDDADAGGVGREQSVTALYEIEWAAPPTRAAAGAPLGVVRVSYRPADGGPVSVIGRPIFADVLAPTFQAARPAFRVAACAAAFAEKLRRSPHAAGFTFANVADALRPAALELRHDARIAEFLRLVEAADRLSK